MRPLAYLRSRFRHPTVVERVFRARCDCGWAGPVRDFEWDADNDRVAHWKATGS